MWKKKLLKQESCTSIIMYILHLMLKSCYDHPETEKTININFFYLTVAGVVISQELLWLKWMDNLKQWK